MHLCFFNDDHADQLKPLTLTRPVDDLRIGIFTIRDKWVYNLNAQAVSRICPSYLSDVFKSTTITDRTEVVWINSQFLPTNDLVIRIEQLDLSEALTHEGRIIAARVDPLKSQDFIRHGSFSARSFTKSTCRFEPKQVDTLWDMLSLNAEEIQQDHNLFYLTNTNKVSLMDGVTAIRPSNIFIAEGAVIEAGAILNANDGPVFVGPGATVESGSILRGPVAICEKATVKMGARISDGTTIGPVCKVGGEVINSIFHSYSNKAHDGFVGNSVIGQWCNFGADTNTSNLKNNYSKIRMRDWATGKTIDTGIQFFGTAMGDHSKTSINTMLNTGTVCGVSSNIFTSGFPPKYIPSFSWLGDGEESTYRLDKALDAMEAMMGRRNIELSDRYRSMMEHLFTETIKE